MPPTGAVPPSPPVEPPATGETPAVERVARRLFRLRLLSVGECGDLLARCDALPWQPAAVIPPARSATVARSKRIADSVQLDSLSPETLEQSGLRPVLERLERVARRVDRTELKLGFTQIQNHQLIRYAPGGFYGWHKDAAVTRFRKVSALLYLSDASTHGLEGGATLFAPRSYRRHWRPVSIEPVCGTAVIFDSRLYHCGLATRAGTKFALLMMFV